jgi:hypothetical protein
VAAGSKQRLGKTGPLVNVDSHMLKAWQILQTFVFPTTGRGRFEQFTLFRGSVRQVLGKCRNLLTEGQHGF